MAEEQAQDLSKSGKIASADNMYQYLGSMMYNNEELIPAQKIGRKNKKKKNKRRIDPFS